MKRSDRADAQNPADDRDAEAREAAPPAESQEDPQALRDRWLRAEAELQNTRRRAARDTEEARRSAEDSFLLQVVEYLDDLERGIASATTAGASPAWVQGFELVAQRMRDALARAGVTRLEPVGQHFDPHLHEALIAVPAGADAEAGTVLEVIRHGYRRGDRVLRHARVAVAGSSEGGES